MKIRRFIVCLAILLACAGAAAADGVYVETPLAQASDEQLNNIALAAQAISNTRLSFGEGFSFNETVGERTEVRGYLPAYNGRGVQVVGGGVAQTATTLYLALMQRDDIEYSSIYTYNENFTGGYVDSGYDAVVTDYGNGVDFAFNSYFDGTLAVFMWMDGDALCCYVAEEGADRKLRDGGWSGLAETPVYDSGAQRNNIMLAAAAVDGWVLEPGETFSFNEAVGPRTAERGYQMALNGRGVRVVGGGAAQVAATVYLAVRDMENVGILEMEAYGDRYAGYYVEDGADAVLVDYGSGVDFTFINTGESDISFYIYVEDDWLVCEVYGD